MPCVVSTWDEASNIKGPSDWTAVDVPAWTELMAVVDRSCVSFVCCVSLLRRFYLGETAVMQDEQFVYVHSCHGGGNLGDILL